jgi:hypothetical protein
MTEVIDDIDEPEPEVVVVESYYPEAQAWVDNIPVVDYVSFGQPQSLLLQTFTVPHDTKQ